MGENNRFSFAKTSFGTLHSDLNELSGIGETTACLWGQLWGQLVNHSATRGQVSIGPSLSLAGMLRLVSLCSISDSEGVVGLYLIICF